MTASQPFCSSQRASATVVAELGDCRLFLSKSVRGVVNSLLQEMGVRTWQSHGPLFTQLETIARKEDESAVKEVVEELKRSGRSDKL